MEATYPTWKRLPEWAGPIAGVCAVLAALPAAALVARVGSPTTLAPKASLSRAVPNPVTEAPASPDTQGSPAEATPTPPSTPTKAQAPTPSEKVAAVKGAQPPSAPLADSPTGTSAPDGMVFVPSATFTMAAEAPDGSGAHAHQVTITRGFFIDKTEVTAAAYARCVDGGQCTATSIHGPASSAKQIEDLSGICSAGDPAKTSYPINCLDYQQAATYCTVQNKRLPTEAEWELAARGTDNRTFPWGETVPIGCDLAAMSGCTKKLGEVGLRPQGASPFGALDMAGNVWEWVADTWSDTPEALGSSDPQGPPAKFLGTLRGGSWDFAAKSSRTFSRLKFSSGSGHVSTGVRCARSL